MIALGTFGMDIGAWTPFLWTFRDREHIMNLLEWASGSRMLYNYIWVGGLFFDVPPGFEERCAEFVRYFRPRMVELNNLLTDNTQGRELLLCRCRRSARSWRRGSNRRGTPCCGYSPTRS